jgi:hypothetical protein
MKKVKKIAITGIFIILILSIFSGYILHGLSQSISQLTEDAESLNNELNKRQQTLNDIENQLRTTQNNKIIASRNLNNTIHELRLRETGDRYTLHDPLFWEARNFLSIDNTDKKTYDEITFNCADYAMNVINNAEKQDIRCAYVVVNFSDSPDAHALIAFNTTDQGIKFFEPQTDEKVNLQIGKSYWADCVVPNGNYYYVKEPGDIIEDYRIYW